MPLPTCPANAASAGMDSPSLDVADAPAPLPDAHRFANLTQCVAAEEFEHGDFKITKDGQLGTLLELTGVAERQDGSVLLVKTAEGQPLHMAVRGIPDATVKEFVEMVRTCKLSGSMPS